MTFLCSYVLMSYVFIWGRGGKSKAGSPWSIGAALTRGIPRD